MHAKSTIAMLFVVAGLASGALGAAEDPLEHNTEHWRAVLVTQLKTEDDLRSESRFWLTRKSRSATIGASMAASPASMAAN